MRIDYLLLGVFLILMGLTGLNVIRIDIPVVMALSLFVGLLVVIGAFKPGAVSIGRNQ